MVNKTDYEVSSGNVFADLGVPNPKAALAKADIAIQILHVIEERGWTPAEAAKRMGVALADLARLRRGDHERFATEQLGQMLDAIRRNQSASRGAKAPPRRNRVRVGAAGNNK